MSRIAKSASLLLRQMTNNLNKCYVISNKSMPLRMFSTILSKRLNTEKTCSLTSIVSKRFAANSPQSDKELSEFLETEIELEKKSMKKALPSLEGWSITTDGSNVIFKKQFNGEEITLKTNVNHSVDARNETEEEIEENREKQMNGEMVCKPDFAVEIKRGNTILGVNCSYMSADDVEEPKEEDVEEIEDEFQINEISIFEGEFKDSSYAVAGDVMDGSMYDLMMDLLHERGINQDFAKKLIEYTTVYEHSQYVGLLQKLKSFISQK